MQKYGRLLVARFSKINTNNKRIDQVNVIADLMQVYDKNNLIYEKIKIRIKSVILVKAKLLINTK